MSKETKDNMYPEDKTTENEMSKEYVDEQESPIGPCGKKCKTHLIYGCKGCPSEVK